MVFRQLVLLLLAALPAVATPINGALQDEIFHARNRVMPALVHIQPVIKNYGTGELEKQAVIGSGVVFHEEGYVVTNYHVAGKSERIICTLHDKEQVTAQFVGGDPLTDVAVIKLNLDDYSGDVVVAEFGDSESLQVGQFVLAMGSPLSLSRSVSAGVISTRDRYFGSDVRLPSGERTGQYNLWIQTDAAINPGNSGGPLVDLQGRVIGINSRATMFANNIGFAIPINIVKSVTMDILSDGEVVRSWIGVHCQPLQELENFFNTEQNTGVLVSSIDPGSPAEAAFLKAGDIILEVNGEPTSARFYEELPAFYGQIADFPPGTEVSLTVLRDEQTYTFTVTTRQLGDLQGEDFEARQWGFTVKAITEQMQIEGSLEDTLGVIVTGVKTGGSARTSGLRRGDVIMQLNDTDFFDLPGFIAEYNSLKQAGEEKVLLTVHRGGATRFVLLQVSPTIGELSDE